MGRLIDFDVCEKILTEFYESSLNDHDAMLFVEFMAQLENVPTAYDVEKVVSDVEEYANSKICWKYDGCPYQNNPKVFCENCGALGALDIVRKGGVE